MKKALLIILTVNCIGSLFAQKATVRGDEPIDVKYRRSSLYTILLESDQFPYKDTVIAAYYKAPFPDKYNDHTVGERSFNPALYSGSTKDSSAYPSIIANYLDKNKIANKMVGKWFNRQENGAMDMGLIAERGAYNASEFEAGVAMRSTRGLASLSDAGEELIGNTFVVVSQLNFMSNEKPAAVIRDAAKEVAYQLTNPIAREIALVAADVAYEAGKEGYSVWTTAYLYRLVWNDSIASVFYNDLWVDESEPDSVRKEAFDNTDLFRFEYIGSEKARNIVMLSFKESRTDQRMVEIATIRNMDAVYAKLQKKYDVFKTKTPLLTVNPLTAKIGMKEGIEKGDKFEVLEQQIDAEGRTTYVKKGVIEVDKKRIWDNRFAVSEKIEQNNLSDAPEDEEEEPEIDRTYFKGGKNYYPGMLIRQIK